MSSWRAIAIWLGFALLCTVLFTLSEGLQDPARQQGQLSGQLSTDRRTWCEPVSWSPRAAVCHNFISDAEAEHYIRTARPFMKRSTVVDDLKGGQSMVDSIRTSYGTFIRRNHDPVIAAIERRVALWTKLPAENQEDTQVLRYEHSQKYGAHYDNMGDDSSPRAATVLMYLSDVEEGGETAFTLDSKWVDPALAQKLGPFSPCAKGRVAFKPKRGDALLFWSLNPDGKTADPLSMHTACPVIRGVKWVAIKWIHALPFRPEELNNTTLAEWRVVLPEDCHDEHEHCADWAANGECERNPNFMLGDHFAMGACRAACAACELCAAGDLACKNRNRVAQGYLPLFEDPSQL